VLVATLALCQDYETMGELVPAKCPQCGAAIRLNPNQDWVRCDYCKTDSFIQRPQGPPPPAAQPQQMVINLNVPGAIPFHVNLSPNAVPPAYNAQGQFNHQAHNQAAYDAHQRVAQAQLQASAQMNNAYQQVGNQIQTSIKITGIVVAIITFATIFLTVAGVVTFVLMR
jgi:hypothetical protein